MVLRKNIVVPAVAATFVTALAFSGSLITGLASIFNASLVAATSLFNIFLIIALVTAMLGALHGLGADLRMVTPFRRVMRNGHSSFWVLVIVTYGISLFFWPTPAVPLIGAVLIPVAIRAGLSPMGVGVVVAIAGQGMALSSDYVIRVAPGLSAKAAGADPDLVADRSLILSLITGGVALGIAYMMEFRKMRKPSPELLEEWESTESVLLDVKPVRKKELVGASTGSGASGGADSTATGDSDRMEPTIGHGVALRGTPAAGSDGPAAPKDPDERMAILFAILVPVAYLVLIGYFVVAKVSSSVTDLKGGDAAALVGGVAVVLLVAATMVKDRGRFLETSATHVVDGLVFAFKAMGVVLPIAGFFFLGNGDFAGQILGLGPDQKGPALLFEIVAAGQEHIPTNGMVTGFGVLIIGMIAGLEGSGFSGLPLTGALAGSLGPAVHMSPETLASIGQMGNIWSGGGTLVAWSSLVAVAGFARVPVVELARKCFIPVVTGLIVATLFAVLVM
ncbi:MAG TPA: hypothetical protein VIS06_06775 [Mycobacteriales bacterium]